MKAKAKEWSGRDRNADMMLLAHAFFDNLKRDDCEFGGWGVDDKRPFGNSDVEGDIIEILGLEDSEKCPHCGEFLSKDNAAEYARGLYDDLGPFLKKKWREAFDKEVGP